VNAAFGNRRHQHTHGTDGSGDHGGSYGSLHARAAVTEDEREALLALTRSVVKALNARSQAEDEALRLYHGEVNNRAERAYELLRVVHRADEEYAAALAEAKNAYRDAVGLGAGPEEDALED